MEPSEEPESRDRDVATKPIEPTRFYVDKEVELILRAKERKVRDLKLKWRKPGRTKGVLGEDLIRLLRTDV